MTINLEIYQKLLDAAISKSYVTYGSLARIAGLDTEFQQDRNTLGDILGAISIFEHENNRPLLSVVAWFSRTPEPSKGFYNLAESLGIYSKKQDKDSFFITELNKVYDFGGNKENHPRPHTFNLFPNELPDDNTYLEGCKKTVTVNRFERNPSARKECIQHFGAKCSVCNINFEDVFGEIGKGYIHVHHKVELSSINKEYKVNPIKDLIPVCPNCHAMLHQKKPPFTIEELVTIFNRNKNSY